MRRRVHQPVVRVSKIEDTPLGRDYRDELMLMANSASAVASMSTPSNNSSINAIDIVCGSGGSPSALGVPSYPPSEMDASVAGSEHLTSEELVNCTCRRLEEDGLMIQCDICLCWQHGYCVGIEDEDPVPEKHVCETCRQPPGGRSEARFSFDQDWLKEGKLPSAEHALPPATLIKSASAIADKETAFRKLSELMADLANLSKVLHGLRVKLHVASQPNNSKVFMWSSVWSLPTPPILTEAEPVLASVDYHKEATLVDTPKAEAESDSFSPPKGTPAFDPQAVADKLNLMTAQQADREEEPNEPSKVNGTASDEVVTAAASNDEVNNAESNTKTPPTVEASTPSQEAAEKLTPPTAEETSKVHGSASVDHAKTEVPPKTEENGKADDTEAALTNGDGAVVSEGEDDWMTTAEEKKDDTLEKDETAVPANQNGTDTDEENPDDGLLDTSFIPSVSEVERLLPSVIQASLECMDGESSKACTSSSSVVARPSAPHVIIPEPKRLNKDECRLNLLQHIDTVQAEIEKRFTAVETALSKIEAMPGTALTSKFASGGSSEAKSKTKLAMLIQDLAIARQMMWTL
jgi:hypothetical protein